MEKIIFIIFTWTTIIQFYNPDQQKNDKEQKVEFNEDVSQMNY